MILDGEISINPFFFNLESSIKDQNLEYVIDKFISRLYDYKDSLHENFNGNIKINLSNIKILL